MVASALQAHLPDLSAYPDPEYRSLRSALGQFHQLGPEFILPGNGAAELLTWAGRELAECEVTYLLTPHFSDYQRALKSFHASVSPCPLVPAADGRWELSELPTLTRSTGFLLNNPHNPTGTLFAKSLLLPLLESGALVVVDEAFMDFLPPDEQQSAIAWVPSYPNLVVLRSLTKFYSLPGLRLGYAIAHPDRCQRWQQWRDPWAVNALAASVGTIVLQDQEFQQQTWAWLAAARPQLFEQLAALPGLQPSPSAANYLLVRSGASVTALQTELLKRHRILIRDCLSYPELGDRYFRVAVRLPAENQKLLAGLTEILLG